MARLGIPRYQFWYAFLLFLLIQAKVIFSYQYKVGDLDAWNIPTSANPHVYVNWPKKHNFKIGDSLLFLYPPSQDSVIQVTKESFSSCNLKDPILYMNNGNSLFNITQLGEFYFTSGAKGHCEKSQKLHISVGNGSYVADSPAYGPSADSPSYPTVFGGAIPVQASSSSPSMHFPLFVSAAIGLLVCALARVGV